MDGPIATPRKVRKRPGKAREAGPGLRLLACPDRRRDPLARPGPALDLDFGGLPIRLRVWTAREWADDPDRPGDYGVDIHPNGCRTLMGLR